MADTAYTPKILELSAKLAALQDSPVGEMYTPEEVAARQAANKRNEMLSVAALLSGDKVLQHVGNSQLTETLRRMVPRYTEHGEFDPEKGSLKVFPEYTRRMQVERMEKEKASLEARDAAAQEAAARAQAQRDFLEPYKDAARNLQTITAQMKQQKMQDEQRKALEGKPLQGKLLSEMTSLGKDVDSWREVEKQLTTVFNPKTSKGVSMYGGVQDAIASAVPAFAPDQWVNNRAAWGSLQRLKEIKDRHANFGATLTPAEKASWDQVTPPRGATAEQLNTWMDQQRGLILRAVQATANAAAAAGGHKKQIEELSRGIYKAPEIPAATPAPAGGDGADFIFVPGKGLVASGGE